MQKDKLLIVFPDGVGVRNYLYSNVLEGKGKDLVLFHNFEKETVDYIKSFRHLHGEVEIPQYNESTPEKFFRELISLCRLKYNVDQTNNTALLYNWNSSHSSFSKKIFYKTIEIASNFCKDYNAILKLETRYSKVIRKNPFYAEIKAILSEINPQQVFCSHQRGLKMATIFAAAKDLGIPTVTVIYSWDNLPKGRMPLRADKYLVWSEYMKNEMALFYPEIPAETVHITGTPQFEFYKYPENIIDKEVFYDTYNLDTHKKIICFSGDDEKTSPDDPKYLNDIAEAIVDAGLQDKFQILLRRCPVDLSGRYDKIIAKYPQLIKEAAPLWNFHSNSNFNGVYPLYDDIRLLVSTAFYGDVVVNLGSTMAFDFAMFDKPCIFINYDQEIKEDPNWSVEKVYKFQHFKSMGKWNPVGWLNSRSEIVPLIQKAISFPQQVGPDRKLWMEKVVNNPLSANFDVLTK